MSIIKKKNEDVPEQGMPAFFFLRTIPQERAENCSNTFPHIIHIYRNWSMSDILLFCVKKYLCFRRLDKSKKNRQYIEKDNDRRKGSKSGMILAIDMGNTNIVIGCIADEKIYFEERIATD